MSRSKYQWPDVGIKNSFFASLLRDKFSVVDMRIPVSCVFEAGFPRCTYMYETDTNEVLRIVDGEKLQAGALLETFLQASVQEAKSRRGRERAPDIIAQLIFILPPEESAAPGSAAANSGLPPQLFVEALTQRGLADFLAGDSRDPRRHHSLLQQVLVPDAGYYAVVRVAFNGVGDGASLVQRRQSKLSFLDSSRPPDARLLLFDGQSGIDSRVSPSTAEMFVAASAEIARHVAVSQSLRIDEMILYFSLQNGSPTLLFCSSISTTPLTQAMREAADAPAPPAASSPLRNRLPPSAFSVGGVTTRVKPGADDAAALADTIRAAEALEKAFSSGDPLGRRPAGSPSRSAAGAAPAPSALRSSVPPAAGGAQQPPERHASEKLASSVNDLFRRGWKNLPGVSEAEERVVRNTENVRAALADVFYSQTGGAQLRRIEFPVGVLPRLRDQVLGKAAFSDLLQHLGFRIATEKDVLLEEGAAGQLHFEETVLVTASDNADHRLLIPLLDVWLARFSAAQIEREKQRRASEIRRTAMSIALSSSM